MIAAMLEISGIYKSYHRQEYFSGSGPDSGPGECVGIVGITAAARRLFCPFWQVPESGPGQYLI